MNTSKNYQIDIDEASVYVGTYGKYNSGSLYGKWLKLSDYADKAEFYEACAELHKHEYDPEFMFQDYENIPKGLIGESWMSDNLFTVLEAIRRLDDNLKDAFMIWCNNGHHDLDKEDIEDLVSSFESEYCGEYDNEEDYAYELIQGRSDLNEFALQYFDYEAYAKDLFGGDHWFEDGYVFQSI